MIVVPISKALAACVFSHFLATQPPHWMNFWEENQFIGNIVVNDCFEEYKQYNTDCVKMLQGTSPTCFWDFQTIMQERLRKVE